MKQRSFSLLLLVVVQFLLASEVSATVISERPLPSGGGPTEVLCSMAVLDLDEINDASQNFAVNLFLTCRWDDPRQAHDEAGKVSKDLGAVWNPSLFFLNRQKVWSQWKETVEISQAGEVVYRQKFWGDFSQPMALRDFPFDSQDLAITLMAGGSYEHGEVLLREDPLSPSFVTEKYSVADWKTREFSVETGPLALPTGQSAAVFTMHINVERISTHYLVKFIAPLLMILALSWVVFWLDPQESAQLGVAVTTCLTVIAYHLALSSRLPKIPYLTHLDIFVFGATLLVFLAMVEVVTTTRLARVDRIGTARALDRASRMVFPSLLALIMAYAFLWR